MNQPNYTPTDLPAIWPLCAAKDQDVQGFKQLVAALHAGDTSRTTPELIRCGQRPDYWVMTYCFTRDEHDPIHPIKRFPRYKYIPFLLRVLASENRVAIPKTRQMRVTWTVLSYLLNRAMFIKHRLIFVQSKKEEDAAAHIDRIKHMYEYLPWWQKAAAPLKRPLNRQPHTRLMFQNGSTIIGVPQGQDVLRQYTASILFGDEFAFQEKAEEAYNASKPTIEGGGQIIVVSSPNGMDFFYRVCMDRIGETVVGVAA